MAKKTIYITEAQKKKIKKDCSAMAQVHNKVNAGIMDAVTCGGMMEESKADYETWYRGYNSKYGSQNGHLLWLTDDISYARCYGNRVEEVIIDTSKVNAASLDEIDEIIGDEYDYYQGPTEEEAKELLKNGYNAHFFEANHDMSDCMCLWDNSPIVSRRELSREEYNDIELYDDLDIHNYDDVINESVEDIEDLVGEESLFDATSILEEFLSDKEKGIKVKQWNLIPAEQYRNLLTRYMSSPEMARIPYEVVYRWFKNIIVPNALSIYNITALAGHTDSGDFPAEDVSYVFNVDCEDYDDGWKILDAKGFYDWCKLPDGSDGWSDYGLQPLLKTVFEFTPKMTSEDLLILINRCLDVVHQRGDLASAFIEGGKAACASISGVMREGAEPEADKYHIAGEGGNNEYFHTVNETPDNATGKIWRDPNAIAFIRLLCNGKLYIADKGGQNHISIIDKLVENGEIEPIEYDELPYSEFANEIETGRYWPDSNLISCWDIPKTKQELSEFSNLIYDLQDMGLKIDRKTLNVDMWKRIGATETVIPYSWLFNGTWETLKNNVSKVLPIPEDPNAFRVYTWGGAYVGFRNGDLVGADEYERTKTQPQMALAESLSSRGYDFRTDLKSILKFMRKEGLNVYPYPKIKLDWENQEGLFIRTGYYLPEDKTVVVFCKDRHPKDILRSFCHEMIHHMQNLDGKDLNFATTSVKDDKRLEEIESEAYVLGNIYFRKWTEHNNKKEMLNEGKKNKVVKNDEGEVVPEKCDKCGGDVVLQIHGEPIYLCRKCKKYFGTMPFPENLNEELETEITSDEVDLSSFNIKHHLNPMFWKDGHLDSRIRLKLLDISDDFIDFLNVEWAKPKDVIITGSIANFNWHKDYSDIDLHVLYDFSDIDENLEFVKEYFDSKKKLWNEEHKDLKVYDFPVEVYVQDVNEKHASSGVYSLDTNEWIIEPEREKLANSKVNKEYIKEKVAKYVNAIDLLNDEFYAANGDEYKTRVVSEKAEKLFKAIKNERTKEFSKGKGEISNGNVTFKALRRLGYIGRLIELRRKCYDTLNSL